jgi:hypothetical protein
MIRDEKKSKDKFFKILLLFFIVIFFLFLAPGELKAPTSVNVDVGQTEPD